MANTVRYFRDVLAIDQNLIASLNARYGDTLVFGARQVTVLSLTPYYNYVFAADRITVAGGAISFTTATPSAVTVLAANIDGPLSITCAGTRGAAGADGEPGESGITDNPEGGRPIILPGGRGGNGEDGEPGEAGGNVVIAYTTASATPTGAAPGGLGGVGGKGGPGGAGRPPGKAGSAGRQGPTGASGMVKIQQVATNEVWRMLDADSARQWAAYRAEVAGYLFRKFDYDSQTAAVYETSRALVLNPADPDATAIQTRIINRQTPSGMARDLDIAPDFPALSANLTAEIAVVQNAFQSYVSVVSLETIEASIRESLSVMRSQLLHRKEEAQADVAIANQDVTIAKAEQTNLQKQIDDVQKDIDRQRDKSFTFGDLITSVGAVAGAVMAISTGVGAIISIPAGLAALKSLDAAGELEYLFRDLKKASLDPEQKKKLEQDVAAAKGLGGDLKDVVKGTKATISFVKVISDLDAATSKVDQREVAKLLRQQAVLVRDMMVASLREKQARARVAVAQLRVNNLVGDIADIDQRLAHWAVESAFLAAATDVLIRSARRLVDLVMEDVFLAQRAREIYQMEGTPGLRFDYGFLHPDDDRRLKPAPRAAATLMSLADMPIEVLSWIRMFHQLNTAQIGFDVIHPQLSLTITDPAQLQAFASGAALSFSVNLNDVPNGMFELKMNAMQLELMGATSTQSANVWITHSGQWSMKRRTDGSLTTMMLRPRREVFALPAAPASDRLKASIPANPQSNSESGPPFSFWGRGAATTFRLQIVAPSTMNLSQLSAIHVAMDCIGYAPQIAGARLQIKPEVRVLAMAPVADAAVA